jgi:beta-N-acetylhexosaminidase
MLQIADAGQALIVGFEGTTVNDHVREALKLGAAGFIFFARNWESPAQVADLIAEIRALASGRRLLFAVDQEGGRVARFRAPATIWPPLRALGLANDARLAEEFGVALGREAAALGFDWDFAPVLDVDSNSANPVIGDRSFGADPARVGRLGAAVIAGLQRAGVMACAKHFPGHGDTETDSHHELPRLPHDRRRLDAIELPPFRAAVAANVAGVMTAHIVVEGVDPHAPATMSKPILGILRDEMKFGGIIVSDDLEMRAIADRQPLGEAAVAAVRAGCDLLLVCHRLDRQEEAVRAIFDAHRADRLPVLRLHERQRRVEQIVARFPPPVRRDLSVVGRGEHLELAERIREQAERNG